MSIYPAIAYPGQTGPAIIQMNTQTLMTGTIGVPGPANAKVTAVNGIASVSAEDVPAAIAAGWTVMANQPWPASRLLHMSLPNDSVGLHTGQVTFPDGTISTLIGPIAILGTPAIGQEPAQPGVPENGGSGYVNGTYANVPLTGGNGYGALATIVVAGGAVTLATVTNGGLKYAIYDTLSAAAANLGGTGSGFLIQVGSLSRGDILAPIKWGDFLRNQGFVPTPGLSFYDGA